MAASCCETEEKILTGSGTHRLAALWEPMSFGRPAESEVVVRSFTKRGSAMDARLHTCVVDSRRVRHPTFCALARSPTSRTEAAEDSNNGTRCRQQGQHTLQLRRLRDDATRRFGGRV